MIIINTEKGVFSMNVWYSSFATKIESEICKNVLVCPMFKFGTL